VAGTLGGGLVGLVAVTLLDAPGLLAAAAILIVYAGLLVMKRHSRWMVAASTAAIVLGAGSVGDSEATALTRLAMVVVGVLVVLVAAAIAESLVARHATHPTGTA